MRNIRKNPILLFVIAVLILYAVIYVIPKFSGALRSTYTVEYGELQTYDDVQGYLVKNEKVYFAGKGGTENRYIKEGSLIRKGTAVMKIEGSSDDNPERAYRDIRESVGGAGITTDNFRSKAEGIVSYHADGYEAELTPKNMTDKDLEYYQDLKNDRDVDLKRQNISKSDPVFKIVDRSGWYLVCFVPASHKERYEKGQQLKITISEDGDSDGKDSEEIVGKVNGISSQGGKTRLIIRTDYYYSRFATARVVKLKVVTSDAMGLILQNSCITEKAGEKGVYVRQKTGDYEFTRIQIVSTDGRESVVTPSYFYDSKGNAVETVSNYDVILRKP